MRSMLKVHTHGALDCETQALAGQDLWLNHVLYDSALNLGNILCNFSHIFKEFSLSWNWHFAWDFKEYPNRWSPMSATRVSNSIFYQSLGLCELVLSLQHTHLSEAWHLYTFHVLFSGNIFPFPATSSISLSGFSFSFSFASLYGSEGLAVAVTQQILDCIAPPSHHSDTQIWKENIRGGKSPNFLRLRQNTKQGWHLVATYLLHGPTPH